MPSKNHKIGRVKFVIDIQNKDSSDKLMNRISSTFNNAIAPAISELFDEYSPNSDIHQLENCEIILDPMSENMLEARITDQITRKLRGWLSLRMRPQPANSSRQKILNTTSSKFRTSDSPAVKRISENDYEKEILRQILQDGFFHGGTLREDTNVSSIIQKWLERKPVKFVNEILKNKFEKKALQRIESYVGQKVITQWTKSILEKSIRSSNDSFSILQSIQKIDPFLDKQIHKLVQEIQKLNTQEKSTKNTYKNLVQELQKSPVLSLPEKLVHEYADFLIGSTSLRQSSHTRKAPDQKTISSHTQTIKLSPDQKTFSSYTQTTNLTQDQKKTSEGTNQMKYFQGIDDGLSGADIFELVQSIFSTLEKGGKVIADLLSDPTLPASLKSVLPLLQKNETLIRNNSNEVELVLYYLEHSRFPFYYNLSEHELLQFKPGMSQQELDSISTYKFKTIFHKLLTLTPHFARDFHTKLKALPERRRQQVILNLDRLAFKKTQIEILKTIYETTALDINRRRKRDSLQTSEKSEDEMSSLDPLLKMIYNASKTEKPHTAPKVIEKEDKISSPSPKPAILENQYWDILQKLVYKNKFVETDKDLILTLIRQKPYEVAIEMSKIPDRELVQRNLLWIDGHFLSQWASALGISNWNQIENNLSELHYNLSNKYPILFQNIKIHHLSHWLSSGDSNHSVMESIVSMVENSIRFKHIVADLEKSSQKANFTKLNPFANQVLLELDKKGIIKKSRQTFPREEEREKVYRKLWDDYGDLQEIPVKNAGVVIIWPFLHTLFKKLHYLNKSDQFVSDLAMQKAVVLLHYICTNSLAYEEHHLVLNKVFCGFPVDAAIEQGFVITEDEKKMANKLLCAVIKQWSALKQSSIQALRGSFLLRNGLLTNQDHRGWSLRVERKPFDLLINKMPWGFSMIRFRWVSYTIRVDWNYSY